MEKWAVYWDNGKEACGTFPQRYTTEDEAQTAADEWAAEMNAMDGIDPESEDSYSAEPIQITDE